MRVFDDAWNRDDLPRGTVATVGNFDGVHRGQRSVLKRVTQRSAETGLQSIVVTFEPHPLEVQAPDAAPPRLTTGEQKLKLLEECGIDTVAVVRFDRQFAATSAQRFAREFLFGRLDVRELYVGAKFAFGRDREGTLELLRSLAGSGDRRVEGLEELMDDGERISSTRIRRAISAGEVAVAGRLIGRPYAVVGQVVPGDAIGRKLGWRTANLQLASELTPGFGVYWTRLLRAGAPPAESITNVGLRPTLHEDTVPVVETHVLDFEGNLYGSRVEVQFIERLRGERRFESIEALRSQIRRDVAEVRRRIGRLTEAVERVR